jgi:ketosteroid isomerase-like protein
MVMLLTMNTASRTDIASIIHAMDEEFMRLLTAGELKQLTANFYAEDAQFLPPNLPAFVGRPAIQQAWKA